ncbi:uncharacterized protein LOC124895166, partial [Capsicum annuum]|uniref:uncharacterized protein LOC124895166 n=1 Tax=Capsicum annuum TaxID=4072 RepID=UPI001FB157AF
MKDDKRHLELEEECLGVDNAATNAYMNSSNPKRGYDNKHKLGHIGQQKMNRLSEEGLLGAIDEVELSTCESCLTEKIARKSFGKGTGADTLLQLIHFDIFGLMNVRGNVFIEEQDSGMVTEIESCDVTFMENDFTKQGEIGQDISPYETMDQTASSIDIPMNMSGSHVDDNGSVPISSSPSDIVSPSRTMLDLELHQMDVKTAFLNRELEGEIYMKQSVGFMKKTKKIMDLNNLLCDDDILIAASDIEYVKKIKEWLSSTFEMKDMGETPYILGVKISRDRSKTLLSLYQEYYIKKVLKRFNMQDCKPINTSISKSEALNQRMCPQPPQEKEQMRKGFYANAVESLLYARMCTRPDIFYVIG